MQNVLLFVMTLDKMAESKSFFLKARCASG